jgi:hypothetical protein
VEAAGLRLPWGSALRLQGGFSGFIFYLLESIILVWRLQV